MNRGFTLLEILVATAIMGVLLVGGASAVIGWTPKYRLRRATWEVQTRLNYARYKAVRQGCPVRVRFLAAGYLTEKYIDGLDLWQPDSSGAIEGVGIQANNTPTFHPSGTVSNLATILVSNTGGKYKITVAITGRIKTTKL